MITIRYPTGLALTYNDATFLRRDNGKFILYTREGGNFIAETQASAGATAEFRRPCTIDQGGMSIRKVVERLAGNPFYLHDCSVRDLARLKRALQDVDAGSGTWNR